MTRQQTVLETSAEAYHLDKMKSKDLTDRLLAYAKTHKRFTARTACQALGKHIMDHQGRKIFVPVETATMSGIIRPLVGEDNNGILRRELEKHPCEITGNNVFWLYHKDYTPQQSMFNH